MARLNGTTTATLRVIYPATNLGPGRATQHRSVRGEASVGTGTDAERLADVGDWLVQCDTGADFLARVGAA